MILSMVFVTKNVRNKHFQLLNCKLGTVSLIILGLPTVPKYGFLLYHWSVCLPW